MGNSLIAISAENVLSQRKYEEIGENTDLDIVYKSNGQDYQIETYFGDQYTLTGSTVNSISESTRYTVEEVMNILYVVYEAYDSFKTAIETSDPLHKQGIKKLTKKFQDKMVNTISELLNKYNYEDVYEYFTSMPVMDLISLFNGQEDKAILDSLHRELAPVKTLTTNGEQEELVSRYFN